MVDKIKDIEDVIMSLQNTTQPYHSIDVLIGMAIESRPTIAFATKEGYNVKGKKDTQFGEEDVTWSVYPPYYTSNIDDALLLIPYHLVDSSMKNPLAWNLFYDHDNRATISIFVNGKPLVEGIRGCSPAVAICIAALKARLELLKNKDIKQTSEASDFLTKKKWYAFLT